MADVSLLTVVDSTKVGVRHVPKGAREVFLPVLDTVFVLIARVFTPGGVGFARIEDAVEIGVLFTVVKGVVVRVVVSRVAGLSWVAVSAVHFDTVADTVVVRVGRGRIGQKRQGLVGVVEAVSVGVGSLRVGGRDAINLSGERSATTGPDTLDRVAR